MMFSCRRLAKSEARSGIPDIWGATHEKYSPFPDLPGLAAVGARVEQNFGRFHGLNIIAGLEIRLTQDEIVVADETKTVYRHHTSLVRRTQFSIGHLDSAPVVIKNRQIVAVWHWTTVGDQFQAGGWGSTTS
jgi:hypothetical protein